MEHWHRRFENFMMECGADAPDRYRTIIRSMSPDVYAYVEDCADYEAVVQTLQNLYIKRPNEVLARHLLTTRRQQPNESIDGFLLQLRRLSKDCTWKPVTSEQYREQLVCDAFINGLQSPLIRQRLLENKTLTLNEAFHQANSLYLIQKKC